MSAVTRLPDRDDPRWAQVAAMAAAYHLRTEAEKGAALTSAAELPPRYRTEVEDPRAAFTRDAVLLATNRGAPAGCVVVTAAAGGRVELKRLWVDPAHRREGVASALVRAALAHAGDNGVRLSVWEWRTDAISLYERHGFTRVPPWDAREGLVCMELAPRAADQRSGGGEAPD